jgi:hypothetical protein
MGHGRGSRTTYRVSTTGRRAYEAHSNALRILIDPR